MQNVSKCRTNNILPLIKLIIYIISFISFILSFFYNFIYLIILSVPFNLIFLCFIHEIGHYIGCKIKNKKVKLIRIFSIKYEDKKLCIVPTFNFGGVVSFLKDRTSSKLIYIMGPIFSLFISIIILLLYLIFKEVVLFVLLVLSVITLFCVSIPYRGSDIYNLIYNGGN